MTIRRFLILGLTLWMPAINGAAQSTDEDGYAPLLEALEHVLLAGEADAYLSLLSPAADRNAAGRFANLRMPASVDRVTLTPRFQLPIDDRPAGSGHQVTLEVFFESGTRGRLETWQIDIVRDDENAAWRIQDQSYLDSIAGLHHLGLTPTKQFAPNNLVVVSEDLSLTLIDGAVFVAETDVGVTGLVLLGTGVMRFAPQPEPERGQVRIFSGNDTLNTEFEAAFVRVNPEAFRSRISTGMLVEDTVDSETYLEARAIFDEFIPLSFTLDLSDVSDRVWSLNPPVGDFLAEVRTKRHGTLTYVQSIQQPEDISLYERETNRIISLYPSARKRATQGRYYGEDDAVSLDVLDYDVSASFEPLGSTQQNPRATPELIGCHIVGTTRLALRVKGLPITGFSLRLADELVVTSVSSNELGPLLFFRMKGQNNLVVDLPTEISSGTEFTILVSYEGDLPAQGLEENLIANQFFFFEAQGLFGIGEPRYLYSNRSYWYPQTLFTDFATATMSLSVPAGWGVVASGSPADTNPPVATSSNLEMKRFSFTALQPARYLSAVISRFEDHDVPPRQIRLTDVDPRPRTTRPAGAVFYDTLAIDAHGSPRSLSEIETTLNRAADIASFYGSLLSDIPYPSLTVTLTDSRLPGGHSPAYFAMLSHELPRQPGLVVSWRTDPVYFSNYPSFFLAHEIAHQWWGQAVGWKNYHEQWLSEGLAQYFAALYAERDGGPEVFLDILRQMRRWATRHSEEGPIYLGYRLGHLENKPRVFRALVYNKGAMVLHMLRGLIGDQAFFSGLRHFYHQWRFQKAGTDDLQLAFEIAAGRSLTRFFDRWIHESTLPELRFSSSTQTARSAEEVVLRFEQRTEQLFDLPITVNLQYRSGVEESIIVPVTQRVTEMRVPIRGRLRRVRVNSDDIALARIDQ